MVAHHQRVITRRPPSPVVFGHSAVAEKCDLTGSRHQCLSTSRTIAPEKGIDTRSRIVDALKKRGIKLSKKEMEDLASDIAEDLGIGNVE